MTLLYLMIISIIRFPFILVVAHSFSFCVVAYLTCKIHFSLRYIALLSLAA